MLWLLLWFFSLHGCTLLHSITEFIYRKITQHLLPLIHMAFWVAGLRALLRNQRALESRVLSVFLSVLLHVCLSMFTLSVRRWRDA